MNKRCTACGAPSSRDKCEYCGEHIEIDKSVYHSGTSMLSRQGNILSLIFYVVGMVILPLIVMIAAMLVSGLEPTTITSEETLNITTLAIVISYGISTFALLFLARDVFKQDFKKIRSWGNFTLQMIIGIFCTFGAAIVGGILVQLVGVDEAAANQEAVEASLGAMPLAMTFSIVIFAPIVEEIVFRLVLMRMFNWKPILNIIFSSLIFGLMHVIAGGIIHIIPYFLMGLVFAIIYHKNDNIWHATILHVIHNGLTVLLVVVGQGLLTY